MLANVYTGGLAALAALAIAGCLPPDTQATPVAFETCASGLQWTHGDRGSSKMYPGRDCNGCHEDRGKGPIYGASGTVFERRTEQDDCYGPEGATVTLTDATGKTLSAKTNAAGNFWFSRKKASLAMPYTATVWLDGRIHGGQTAHTDPNCGGCHAPASPEGRIVTP